MKKSILIFLICFLAVSSIFFLIPINLFDGEIVFNINGIELKEKAKLSLSYFIGIGAGDNELRDVKDFYLLPMGYFFAFLMLICLPGLITYRITMKKKVK